MSKINTTVCLYYCENAKPAQGGALPRFYPGRRCADRVLAQFPDQIGNQGFDLVAYLVRTLPQSARSDRAHPIRSPESRLPSGIRRPLILTTKSHSLASSSRNALEYWSEMSTLFSAMVANSLVNHYTRRRKSGAFRRHGVAAVFVRESFRHLAAAAIADAHEQNTRFRWHASQFR